MQIPQDAQLLRVFAGESDKPGHRLPCEASASVKAPGMIRWQPFAWLCALVLLCTGCAQPWPADLPAHTYTGVAINGPLNTPAAGAEIRASRPTFKRRGLALGLFPDESEIGRTTADARGRFTLKTTTGFATALSATTADGHLFGTQATTQEDSGPVRLVAGHPSYGPVVYGPGIDPNLPVFKVTQRAVAQIIRQASEHPRESPHSLEEAAKLGTISAEELAAFTGNAGLFFGPLPPVKYGWGKDVLVFPDAGKPIRLRRGKPGFDPVL